MKLVWTLILLLALTSGATAGDKKTSEEKPPCCREIAPSSPPTDKSLYQLDSIWTSDFGKTIKFGVLRGRPVVLALFFTQCEFACPIILHDLKRIEAALPGSLRGKVDFVLVSLDTERDTVTALHTYREKQALPTGNWLLLRGANDDVRELAALLGVNYQKDARGQFAHSNIITVLNGQGEVAFQQAGLNQSPDQTVQALSKAAAGRKAGE